MDSFGPKRGTALTNTHHPRRCIHDHSERRGDGSALLGDRRIGIWDGRLDADDTVFELCQPIDLPTFRTPGLVFEPGRRRKLEESADHELEVLGLGRVAMKACAEPRCGFMGKLAQVPVVEVSELYGED